jgi:hypothetical protein
VENACLGRALSDSNSSINYFNFPVFSTIWGICFSLKANPNGTKNIAFWHTFGTGDAPASPSGLLFYGPIRSIGRIGDFSVELTEPAQK